MREKWEKEDYELLKNPGLAYISESERILWLDHYYLAYGPRVAREVSDEVIFGDGYSYYGILPQDEMKEGFRRMGEFICQLVKAGGHVVTGTDAPAVAPGISLHRDMELLVLAGLTPMQAIQAATKTGAAYLGKEKELGTVEAGKLADVVIVNGDPLTDITQTRRVDTVIKDGEVLTPFTTPGSAISCPAPSVKIFTATRCQILNGFPRWLAQKRTARSS
jgi:hypothetical protein